MTRTTDELKFATRRLMQRYRIPSWQPMAPAAAAPIARRLAAREPVERWQPEWVRRGTTKVLDHGRTAL